MQSDRQFVGTGRVKPRAEACGRYCTLSMLLMGAEGTGRMSPLRLLLGDITPHLTDGMGLQAAGATVDVCELWIAH